MRRGSSRDGSSRTATTSLVCCRCCCLAAAATAAAHEPHLVHQRLERVGLVGRQLCQHLTVHLDVLLLQAVDQLRVLHLLGDRGGEGEGGVRRWGVDRAGEKAPEWRAWREVSGCVQGAGCKRKFPAGIACTLHAFLVPGHKEHKLARSNGAWRAGVQAWFCTANSSRRTEAPQAASAAPKGFLNSERVGIEANIPLQALEVETNQSTDGRGGSGSGGSSGGGSKGPYPVVPAARCDSSDPQSSHLPLLVLAVPKSILQRLLHSFPSDAHAVFGAAAEPFLQGEGGANQGFRITAASKRARCGPELTASRRIFALFIILFASNVWRIR